MTEPTYITVEGTVDKFKFMAVIMKWHRDEFIQTRCSLPMPHAAAVALARSWAVAMGVEVRL